MQNNKIDINKIITTKRLPYECYKSTTKCTNEQEENKKNIRTEFHRDYDRVTFSKSFRRLSGKTQVHPLTDNDVIHTRLTHSIETASVGRSLGLAFGNYLTEKGIIDNTYNANDIATIVQTACLLHDIGNPPFGHAGEEAIKNWFTEYLETNEYLKENLSEEYIEELMNFDGNAQSFRIATKLENDFNRGGLNLTITTLASMIKYPYFASKKRKKFSVFLSESEIFDRIFTELELVKEDNKEKTKTYIRHPLSFLMEAADDICYSLIDIVDAIELNIVKIDDIKEIYIKVLNESTVNDILNDVSLNDTRKASKLTALSINKFTTCAADLFNKNINRFLDKHDIQNINSLIDLDPTLKNQINYFKEFSANNIFTEKNKSKLEIAANKILGDLLDNFINAIIELDKKEENQISSKSRQVLRLMGMYKPNKSDSLYEKIRKVVDFISGMTDRYATSMFQQLNGMSFQFKRI